MHNIISFQESIKDQYYHQLEMQILFLNRKVRDLENHISQLNQNYIIVPTMDGNLNIRIDEIIYCQANSNYTHIFLEGKNKICVSKTLKYIESLLPKKRFIRIHQSHLVNINFIQQYHLGNSAHLRLKTGVELSISKSGVHRMQHMFSQKASIENLMSKMVRNHT